jgi:glyoxylate/hydroxypyruvate reductase A
MSILIDVRAPGWHSDTKVAEIIAPLLPGVTLHAGPPEAPLAGVTMVATASLRPGLAALLPDLQLVQKLGAGVETMVGAADLPAHVRITRLSAPEQADEMAEWALAYILAHLRHLPLYIASQRTAAWTAYQPRRAADTTVAVLGLGHVGMRTAELLNRVGFRTLGWSRSPKTLAGTLTRTGAEGLSATLAEADVVVSVLPSTPDTRGLADAEFFASMKPGALFLNMGRGDLPDDAALLAALDGPLGGAVLDVFRTEPLPPDSPFWTHPKVLISPHVSGWTIDGGLPDIAENYRRLSSGRPLLNEVDRDTGY